LQETKVNEIPGLLFPKTEYPYQYFAIPSNGKKGYAGTAILSKIKPLAVTYGMEPKDLDEEGRVITLEFKQVYLVASYVVNAGEGLKRLDFKQKWDQATLQYIKKLDKIKPVIWCGDLNVSHREIDLARPATNSKYVSCHCYVI
jgi:exodeoxyribonuclease III